MVKKVKRKQKPKKNVDKPSPRAVMIATLTDMPDEAFSWFVLCCVPSAMLNGARAQIWPDGMGGFSKESRLSVAAIQAAAGEYLNGQS